MKNAILTINSTSPNYGNKLQNYAVAYILNSMGCETENIVLYDYSPYSNNVIRVFLKKITPFFYLRRRINKSKTALDMQKEEKFREFSNRYMINREISIHAADEVKKIIKDKEYDYAFVGSDQVWNPDFAGQNYYFLDFVAPNKRIAFSASIGYEYLEEGVLARYADNWRKMRYISVREESAADIIEQKIKIRPDVILDPTLLLTSEEWNEIAQKPNCNVPNRYILCLFLGNMPKITSEKYEKEYGIELIVLNDKLYPDYYTLGPAEFVWLVQNAELVLTDSFHCTVFSIIFRKQFWVFDREDNTVKNMFTRIETLLKRFNMMERVQKCEAPIKRELISEKKFEDAEKCRVAERAKVIKTFGEIFNENRESKKCI